MPQGPVTCLFVSRGPQSPPPENGEKQSLLGLTFPITETSQRCKDMGGNGRMGQGRRKAPLSQTQTMGTPRQGEVAAPQPPRAGRLQNQTPFLK